MRLTRGTSIRTICALAATLAVALVFAPAASAGSYVVNDLGDAHNSTGSAVCSTATTTCTLRAAVEAANFDSATADQITFSVTGIHLLTLGHLEPSSPMTISGNGDGSSGTVIDGNAADRVIQVVSTDQFTLSLDHLRVRNGITNTGNCCSGAGIAAKNTTLNLDHVTVTGNAVGATPAGQVGGGVEFAGTGTLNITDSTVSGNSVGGNGAGGGIFAGGTLHMSRTTVSGNNADSAPASGQGGGIYIQAERPGMFIANSTISGNQAGFGGGGGIKTSSSIAITNTTIAGNTAGPTVGGLVTAGSGAAAQVTLKNTIIAGNTATNCSTSGNLTISATNSIDSATSCGFGSTSGNMSSTDPQLGALGDNGGPTQTRALPPTSPAVDAASLDCGGTDVAGVDQRSISRPSGPACDIGAYEMRYPTASPDSATVAQDSAATPVGVLANDTDPDNAGKLIAGVLQPAHGSAVITGSGTGVTYQPNSGYCNSSGGGPDTFTYTLNGGSTGTVSMTVTCAPVPPTPPVTPVTPPSGDTTPGAPDTVIGVHPRAKVKTRKARARVTFGFSSPDSAAAFQCKLDQAPLAACSPPVSYRLRPGRHTFTVVAVGPGGSDPTAATWSFKVVRIRAR